MSLADAREKATAARRKLARGMNPIDDRKRHGGIPTFGEMADSVPRPCQPVSETRSTRRSGKPPWRPTQPRFGGSP